MTRLSIFLTAISLAACSTTPQSAASSSPDTGTDGLTAKAKHPDETSQVDSGANEAKYEGSSSGESGRNEEDSGNESGSGGSGSSAGASGSGSGGNYAGAGTGSGGSSGSTGIDGGAGSGADAKDDVISSGGSAGSGGAGGSGGTPCIPKTCPDDGFTCGQIDNGCGGKVACAHTCTGYDTCGGVVKNRCGCKEYTVTELSTQCSGSCGNIPLKCSAGTYDCGGCGTPSVVFETCYYNSTAGKNQCGGCSRISGSDGYCASDISESKIHAYSCDSGFSPPIASCVTAPGDPTKICCKESGEGNVSNGGCVRDASKNSSCDAFPGKPYYYDCPDYDSQNLAEFSDFCSKAGANNEWCCQTRLGP